MGRELLDNYSDVIFTIADGFDDAIIGIDARDMRVIYSVSKCIEILIQQGMDDVEAMEYFEFNVSGAYIGEQTPIWSYDMVMYE